MSSRAQRIAERIRDGAYDGSLSPSNDDAIIASFGATADAFSDGKFSDLLGPEVTEDIYTLLTELLGGNDKDMWRAARYNVSKARLNQASLFQKHCVRRAMRYRRLAKWMRELERSVSV